MLVDKYYTPGSIDEALENMALPGLVKALAGGTDMNISLHEREIRPDVIVDLTHVDELRKIHFEDGIVHVGSTATFHEIEEDPIVLEHIPMLAAAASTVGSPQIRALGTAGGNLCNAATAADTVPAMMAILQAHFVAEQMVEMLAEKVGMDKWEFRMKNAIRHGLSTATGQVFEQGIGFIDTLIAAKQYMEEHDLYEDLTPEERAARGV